MTRCISLVGRTRASIRLLTDSTLPDQLCADPPRTDPLGELDPRSPTTRLTRASSASSAWLAMMTSLKRVGHLAGHARPFEGHAGGEVAPLDLGQDVQQDVRIELVGERHGRVGHGDLQGERDVRLATRDIRLRSGDVRSTFRHAGVKT